MTTEGGKKVIIYGLGSLAEYVAYAIENDSENEVMGFTVASDFLPKDKEKHGLPIIAFEEIETSHPPSTYFMFIAVGENAARKRIYDLAVSKGYGLISYVSSKAVVWNNLQIGDNVFISEDTGIQPFVKIGNNNILIGPRVGHHSSIGDDCLLSCCYLAGKVRIGNGVFIALNAMIKQGVTVADHNIIGMGCAMVNDTEVGDVYTNTSETRRRTLKSDKLRTRYLT